MSVTITPMPEMWAQQPWDTIPASNTWLEAGDGTTASPQSRKSTIRNLYSMSALAEQQKELETQLKAVMYPILSLPVEITARIFVECLPADRRKSMSSRHAPLLLMRVCRRWKDIAVSIPEYADQCLTAAEMLADSAQFLGYMFAMPILFENRIGSVPRSPNAGVGVQHFSF
ncbi:hypothetical protein GGX14DRAFT_633386 [Mycena pura]|uniref:F-box domain-containing protein n=1 Tax=Mycena pura TaxID=153505 RepID=A0AAD6Y9F2_9AGAR|nr:hypothetical protein GGX14DRAFT_633386 [Mycena pura]